MNATIRAARKNMDNAGYLQELFGMSGQVAVILGGGGALGIALARGLARNGAKVIIASSRRESCDEAVAKLAQEGIETIGIPTNVTSRESLVALRDKALELTGQVDMLVNCAGANAGSSFLDVDEERWDSIMAVNLKGTMLACKVFIESMLKNKDGGAILNIGS